MNKEALKQQLIVDEGLRYKLYHDSVGKWSIGVGHNIEDKGLSKAVINLMLEEDIGEVETLLDKYLPWWRQMNEARQGVLVNMAFNMGVGPSKEMPLGKLLTFRNTLNAMKAENYEAAAEGMAASLWAKQVGVRAQRLIKHMKEGV